MKRLTKEERRDLQAEDPFALCPTCRGYGYRIISPPSGDREINCPGCDGSGLRSEQPNG